MQANAATHNAATVAPEAESRRTCTRRCPPLLGDGCKTVPLRSTVEEVDEFTKAPVLFIPPCSCRGVAGAGGVAVSTPSLWSAAAAVVSESTVIIDCSSSSAAAAAVVKIMPDVAISHCPSSSGSVVRTSPSSERVVYVGSSVNSSTPEANVIMAAATRSTVVASLIRAYPTADIKYTITAVSQRMEGAA